MVSPCAITDAAHGVVSGDEGVVAAGGGGGTSVSHVPCGRLRLALGHPREAVQEDGACDAGSKCDRTTLPQLVGEARFIADAEASICRLGAAWPRALLVSCRTMELPSTSPAIDRCSPTSYLTCYGSRFVPRCKHVHEPRCSSSSSSFCNGFKIGTQARIASEFE